MQHVKALFVIAAIFWGCGSVAAQRTYTISDTIYFDTDAHAIDEQAAAVLNSLAERLNATGDYDLQVEAYTDERGSAEHNYALTEKRARSTISYLSDRGITPNQQETFNYGKTRARTEGLDEAQRRMDRRVEIHATVYQHENLTQLVRRMKKIRAEEEVITIALGSRGKIVKTEKGTKIYIPRRAFVFYDGTEPKEAIELVVTEAYEPSDWFINRLSTTTTDGQLLRTGGMVKIDARSQGRPLKLAPDKAISLAVPISSDPVSGMEVYYAAQGEDGQAGVQWLPASSPLNSDRLEKDREREIADEAKPIVDALERLLRQYQLKNTLPDAPQFTALPYPVAPTIISPGKEVQQPIREDFVFKPFNLQSRFYSAKKRQRIEMSKYNSALRKYERYEKRRIAYEAALPRYLEQKDSFEQAVQVWEEEIQTRLVEQFSHELYQIMLSDPRFIYNAYTKAENGYSVKCREDDFIDLVIDRVAHSCHELYEQIRKEPNASAPKRKALRAYAEYLPIVAGIDLPPHRPYSYNHLRNSYNQAFKAAQSQAFKVVQNQAGVPQVLWDLAKELRANLELSRMNDKLMEKVEAICSSPEYLSEGLKNSYTMSINRLGWVNIDVLLRFPPADMIAVNIAEPDTATMMLFLPSLNLVVNTTPALEGVYQATARLPQHQQAILVSMKLLDGKAHLAIQEFTIGTQPLAPLEYQEMHPLALLKTLERLRS